MTTSCHDLLAREEAILGWLLADLGLEVKGKLKEVVLGDFNAANAAWDIRREADRD